MEFVTYDKFTPIPNFEDYGINKCGDVCSFRKNKLLKQKMWGAYKSVTLSKKGKTYYFRVHRLVATIFIPNPNNLPQVNHKDGNKMNNNLNNLEWCTCSYNIKHGYSIGLTKPFWKWKKRDSETIEKIRKTKTGTKQNEEWKRKKAAKKGVNHPLARKVFQYDLQGKLIGEYNLVKEAYEKTNISVKSISNCLNGRARTAGGFIWKYANL